MSNDGSRSSVASEQPQNTSYVGKDAELGYKRGFRKQTRWTLILLLSLLSPFLYLVIWGQPTQMAMITRIALFGFGLIASASLIIESKRLHRSHNWPTWSGLHYACFLWIPVLNWIPGLIFFFQRAAILTDSPLLTPTEWPRALVSKPQVILHSLLKLGGISVTLLWITFLLLILGGGVMDTHRSVGLALGYAAFLVVPIGLWMRSFATSTGRAVFDITMRDLTIRANGVLGLLTLAFLTVGGLLLPIGLLAGMLNIFLPIEVGTKILSGLLVSILLLPISAALVLILRALPWIQAFPYILESIIQSLRMWFVETVPVNRDTNSESDSEAEFMPFEGHSHTHVSVDTKTKVSMPGFYGYLPQQVQDLQLTNGTVSVRKGLWLAPPGMIWFTTIFAWRELYPESAAHWLGIFPAESILITSLSYVGIPRLIVTELLGLLGLPESTLSFGFVGGIIPVLLLIPTAWHFVLAYEGWLYHVLAKLGCNNRILFLWIIHLLPLAPLVALTFHLRDRIQQRRTTASAD